MYTELDQTLKETLHLQDIPDLCEIKFIDDEDWLEKRKSTLGGSDVGTVLGLNEYTSKLQLYKSKKTLYARSDTVYTRKGRELENLIFENYVVPYFKARDYDVLKPNKIFVRSSTPWLSANLDGLAIPKRVIDASSSDNIVVEIKWVSQWGASKWEVSEEYGNIPASYYAQVQSYMYHTGASQAIVFAMFDDTWTCESYTIPRNERFIRDMLNATKIFYEAHMLMGIPPKADIRHDTADIAHRIGTEATLETKTSEEYDLMLSKYKALKSSEKELDNEIKDTLNTIIDMHLAGYVPDKVDIRFTCAKRTTKSIDAKKLRELYPEIADQCTKVSEYTWTSVK